jgi:hypothetical protein
VEPIGESLYRHGTPPRDALFRERDARAKSGAIFRRDVALGEPAESLGNSGGALGEPGEPPGSAKT